MAHGFPNTFKTIERPNGGQHMRGVGSLFASPFDPASLPKLRNEQIEETTFSSMSQQATAKFTQDREVKARIGQVQAESILDIDPRAHRISGLSVRQLIARTGSPSPVPDERRASAACPRWGNREAQSWS